MSLIYDTLPPVLPEFDSPAAEIPPPAPRFEIPPDLAPAGPAPLAPFDPIEARDKKRRLANKIARLPADTRERLNQLLHDGLSYADVIAQLGEAGAHLNKIDLSRWMNEGGHDLWLEKEEWLARMETSFAAAKEMAKHEDAQYIYEASLHLAATQMFNSLIGCDPEDLPSLVKKDPDKYFKVLQAIPRFAQMALNFQKFREECAQAKSELAQLRDPNRELTDSERNAILDKLDRILGFK
jgi:hypothetical protein